MKVAIVHDYIKEYGGAERVLETLLEMYPDATVFTSLYAPEFLGPHKERFQKYKIKTSFFQYLPFAYKLISPLRLLSPYAFRSFDFTDYDVIIVSQTGAYFPNCIRKVTRNQEPGTKNSNKGPIHICYTHTPPRYLYGYATARDWKKNKVFAVFAHIANHFLRMVDYNSSKNVDFFIANSEEVKARIKKFYRRDAAVIYPPVEISSLSFPRRRESKKEWIPDQVRDDKIGDYYLTGGRLARAKGIDVIVKAFNENGLPLKIFGKGFAGYEEELKDLAKKNIEFLGEVTDQEKLELMRNAKAFVFASQDEDFGITPVEAMSVGIPVIAYRSGGVKETIIDGKTGLFFEDNLPESLNSAIKKFETLRQAQGDKFRENCIKQAEKFSKENFVEEIKRFVNSKTK